MQLGLQWQLLGIQMSLESSNFVLIIISIVFGAVIGEWIDLDKWLNRLGQFIEKKFGSKVHKEEVLHKDLLQVH